MRSKSVTMRMPEQLYDRVKALADKEYITVSGFIFNILDKSLYQKGVKHVEVIETTSSLPKMKDVVKEDVGF